MLHQNPALCSFIRSHPLSLLKDMAQKPSLSRLCRFGLVWVFSFFLSLLDPSHLNTNKMGFISPQVFYSSLLKKKKKLLITTVVCTLMQEPQLSSSVELGGQCGFSVSLLEHSFHARGLQAEPPHGLVLKPSLDYAVYFYAHILWEITVFIHSFLYCKHPAQTLATREAEARVSHIQGQCDLMTPCL